MPPNFKTLKYVPQQKKELTGWFVIFMSCTHTLTSAICPEGKLTFIRMPSVKLVKDSEVEMDSIKEDLSSSECHKRCYNQENCTSYFVGHVNSTCILMTALSQDIEGHLVDNSAWSYHRKICLKGIVCHRHWSFDVIQGVQLYGYDDKILKNIPTKDTCLEYCSGESTFVCRSARYDGSSRSCVLSRHDRRSAPESFRKSFKPVDYMENQCVSEPPKCLFYQQKGRTLIHHHIHLEKTASTRELCQDSCLNHTDFRCRAFEFDEERSLCLLSPEDTYSLPEPTTPSSSERSFYEKGPCIDVEMHCEATAMTTVVRITTPFRGRVYALGHPYECYAVSVIGNGEVALTMPLHGRRCGTKNLGNGTFINSVVVQHHPFVLRSNDRKIDVACDYEEVQLKLRGGKQINDGDLGDLMQVVTGIAPTPPIQLRVVNSSGYDVRGVELGEPLYLRVEMKDESIFGIFGSGLVARSGHGAETVLLLDDRGCPIDPTVFPSLERSLDSKTLTAQFQAFKFASESTIKFQMTVSFCLDVCPPVDCDKEESDNAISQSYGRRRRSSSSIADTGSLELQSGDVIIDITTESDMFVVNNLKSSQTANDRGKTAQSASVEATHLKRKDNALCMTKPLLIAIVITVTGIQVAMLAACILLVACRRKPAGYPSMPSHSSSRASISSRTRLFPQS